MELLNRLTTSLFGHKEIAPEQTEAKVCMMCLEQGGLKRICCNAIFCDHCYTKNKLCPNCDAATRREKMTGATYILNVYSEHEECRICLDPGLKRRCCGNYYCDDCYYSQPKCRSCEADVGRRDMISPMTKAAVISIILGWLATLFVLATAAAWTFTIILSEKSTPVGVSDYKCYGFFKQCDVHLCIDFDESVAKGTSPLPALSTWKYCDLDSTVKLESYGCIYDSNLYISTDKMLGFDVCYDSYDKGVYIFEDTFEYWGNTSFTSNSMKSAFWSDIYNGHSTKFCGHGEVFGGKKALTFSGEYHRFAETKDLDVSSGGWLEAELFISPIGFDVSHPYCKTSYGSYISVEYSVNQGVNWTVLAHYDAWNFRSKKFFPVKYPLPEAAQTSHTRFRFIQQAFESARDAWALDNVRVYRFLPPDWHTSSSFLDNVAQAFKTIQRAQCCFDTDWCETRLTTAEMDKCRDEFPWYNGRRYLLRGSELFVCVTLFVNLIKFIYISTQDFLVRKRHPFYDEWRELIQMEWFYKWLPPRWRPKRSLSDYARDIHLSARLVEELKDEFNDGEGDGELKLIKDLEEEKERKRQEKERKRKEKKKLMKRMKSKNYQMAHGAEVKLEDSESDEEDDDIAMDDAEKTRFGVDKIASKMDKFKRQNVAMLRIPFDTKADLRWGEYFAYTSLIIFAILALFKTATTDYYIVHEPVKPYGVFDGDISMTSAAMVMFASYCDFKEIYYNIKNVIPCRKQWVPFITIDLTEEINALFVAHHTISLNDITEANNFSPTFIKACAFCYFLGGFPWCLFSLILRDQFLDFQLMRVITPTFGVIMLLRAILGPGFIIKMSFAFLVFFNPDMKARESLGAAMQSNKTKYSAFTAAFSFSIAGAFLCSAIILPLTGMVFGLGFFVGLIFGAASGCFHTLPMRPWMYITVLEGGVWLRVKKKERCPCVYWGNFCNEIHASEEILVVYPTDEVKFLNFVKNGMNVSV